MEHHHHQDADVRGKQSGVTTAVYSHDLFISTQMVVTGIQMTCCSLFIACVCGTLPITQGRIIHSTVVGGGPCKLGRGEAMCCEAKKSRKRKVR